MGLLDMLKEDPALMQGLLAGAFGAMAGRGSRLQAWGQGGLAGLQGYAGAKDRALQEKRTALSDELLKNQLDQQRREAEIAKLPQQFFRPGQLPPTMDNRDVGQPGEPSIPRQFDASGYTQALMGMDPLRALQFQAANAKPTVQPLKLGAGESFYDPKTLAPLATNPKVNEPPNAVQEYQFAVGQGYKGTFEQWDKERKRAGATNVNINPEKSFAQAIGPIAAKNIAASQEAAEAAQSSNATIANIRDALGRGGVILGPGAAARQTGLRVGQLLGAGSKASGNALANTKAVEQGLAQIELDAAKLMKGQGQITEAERAIIRRAAAGDIDKLSPGELEIALRAIERNNQRSLSAHEQRMKQLPAEATGALAPLLGTSNAPAPRRYNPVTGKIE